MKLVDTGTLATAIGEQCSLLIRTRARAVENAIALLGVCGWFPDHLEQHTYDDETWIWGTDRLLAVVATEWPKPNDGYGLMSPAGFTVRFTLRFAVMPLRGIGASQ